nr:unnamed protein product [Callosobruchus chinensis]
MASNLLDTEDPKTTVHLLRAAALIDEDSAIFEYGNALVQRTYFENDSVRIISGGPACLLDLVGRGMLTCYIQGENLMAPPSSLILRTIRELSYNHLRGSLILVPADSGTLLNFGVAIERALNDNLKVKMIPISDDFDYGSKGKIRKRGLSGILLLSKIAGAMSERSRTLTEIYYYCLKVLDNMKSIGFTVPTSKETIPTPCRCMEKMHENYEPAAKKMKAEYDFKQEICSKTYDALLHKKEVPEEADIPGKINLVSTDEVVIVLNTNKALTKVEQFMCAKAFIDYFDSMYMSVCRLYVGEFICELDKANLAVTIFKPFDYTVLEYLDDVCKAPGWRRVNQHKNFISVSHILMRARLTRRDRLSPPIRGPKLSEKLSNVLLYSTQFACEALISCEKQLNMIDSERGKGDTGSRLKRAAETLLSRLQQDKVITNCPFAFFESMSKLLERTVGGATGCIYSIMFEAAAVVFRDMQEEDIITPETWLHALELARDALKSGQSSILFLNPVDVHLRIAILAFLFGVGNSLKKVRRDCMVLQFAKFS